MDQLKTYKLNFNQVKSFAITPVIVFYVKINSIIVMQLTEGDKDVDVDFEFSVDIGESLTDSIDSAIKKLVKQKKYAQRSKVCMIFDDYYLSMYRFNFSDSQMKNFYHSVELEIDHLNEYSWEFSKGPKEMKDLTTILIYLMKTSQLKSIESVFKSNKIFLRRIVTRYHVMEDLLSNQTFKLEPSKLTLFVDVSSCRVRAFCILSNKIKMYRRMAMKPIEGGKKKVDFDSIYKLSLHFLESCMDSYLSRYSNQEFSNIYFYSDSVDLPKQFKKYSVKGVPVTPLEFSSTYFKDQKVDHLSSFPFIYSAFDLMKDLKGFNLIPIMKRFEKLGFLIFSVVFGCLFLYTIVFAGVQYFSLKKELKQYSSGLVLQAQDQVARKSEMIELRDRAKRQQKIIDYADLTNKAYSSQIPIDDFLYKITSITSSDMSFDSIKIRSNKVYIAGTSSSLNGNYSFYSFLQNLEAISYLDRPRYTLSLASGINTSKFTIQMNWKEL